jgi:hypothetical protein
MYYLKHNKYIYEISVKLWTLTVIVQGPHGSSVKHHPIHACIIEAVPLKLKQMWNMFAELIQYNDELSCCETFAWLHVHFVKHIQLAHALFKHNQYTYEINVKLRSITGTMERSDGLFLEHIPICPCIIEIVSFKLKEMCNKLAELVE